MGVLRLLAVLLALAAPAAAQNNWVGGAVGDWHEPANWSAGVPGFGEVLIDADALVIAYATNPAVNLSSVTLGDAGGTFAPVLRLGRGAHLGRAVLHPRSALQLDATDQFTAGDVFFSAGSSATVWTAASAAGGGALRFSVSGTFALSPGATVTARGRGYAPETGPGAGAAGSVASGGGGGGYGAAGGAGGGGAAGGAAYGAASSATAAGSGGGGTPSASGGSGGGVIDLTAGHMDIGGLVEADGEPGESLGFEGGGGGSGGSVRLVAGTLAGGGVLSARGGAGGTGASFGGGGGAGGRVEARVSAAGDLTVSSAAHRANGGGLGGGGTLGAFGGDGTRFLTPRHWGGGGAGNAASNGANWQGGSSPLAGERLVFGASETAKFCSWDLPEVAVGSFTALASYSTSVVLASSMSVTGTFAMAGGTVTAASARALTLESAALQTGGLLNLLGATVTVRGGSHQFFDLRAAVLNAGAPAPSTVTLAGSLDVRSRVALPAGTHLSLSSGVLRLAMLDGPFGGAGTVSASTSHVTLATAALSQLWTVIPGSLGVLRVGNDAGGLTLSTAVFASFTFEGGVTVDTGAVLLATAAHLRVGGDWNAYGFTAMARSTVSFTAAAGTQTVRGASTFDHVSVSPAAGAVTLFSSSVVVASTLTAVSGTLDLGGSTLSVRGGWLEQAGSSVRGGTGRTVFDGSAAQNVHQLGGSSFGTFIASNAVGVALTSATTALWNFEWHRGNLDFAGRDLFVGGDLLNNSAGTLSAFLSTVTLNGVIPQTLTFASLHGLVVDNRHGAGARLSFALSVASFTVRPGAVFNGFNRALTVTGAAFDTAGSTYNSIAQLHSVTWNPAGGVVHVASGSVVNGRLILFNGRTAALAGDLAVIGAGNSFDPRSGTSVLNAPGGSTITFRGSSDLVATAGANWTYGGNVADSWLVFEGTGLARGVSLSTNVFGGVRVAMSTAVDTFRAPDMNLLGDLVIEGGSFKPNGARVISVGGDVIQSTAGVVFFQSSGTLRLAGSGAQTVSLVSSSHTLQFVTIQTTASVSVVSDLMVKGDFMVVSGSVAAGAGVLQLQGSRFVVSTGAYFDGQTSTAAFEGAFNGKTFQSIETHGGGAFHGVVLTVSSAAFLTSSTMSVLTHAVAGSTMAVAPGMRLRIGDLRASTGAAARVRWRSTVNGLPWQLQLVTVSSVTDCIVSDSDASSGITVRADDGRALDQGGNVNWDFSPQLLTVFPGETLTPGVAPGKTGTPATLVVGSTVTVLVQAQSSRFDLIGVSSPIALVSDDPYAVIPATLALVGGATTFAYSPRLAEPSPRNSVVSAAASFSSGGSTLTVVPDALASLQVLLPGETAAPGRDDGKTGTAFARVANVPFTATVRAVDRYFNVIATITHVAAPAVSASSATLPAPAALVAGARVFTGLAVHATGFFTMSWTDLTDPAVRSGTSAVFGVAPPSVSSPTAAFHVPPGARVATLGGAVSGTASDSSSVERVSLDLYDATGGFHYDWNTGAFTSAAAFFATATLASPLAAATTWHATAPDGGFVDGRRYVFTARIDDPSGFTGTASSTFTFDRSTLLFGVGDGQGSAAVLPVSTAGCAAIVSTLTYTVGAAGLAPGSAVAVRAPEGWSGSWVAVSTSLASASTRTTVSPPSLGAGWFLLELSTASPQSFLPGQRITFTHNGLPPLSALGRGPQAFPVLSRGSAAGTLLAVSTFPVMTLSAGVEPVLAFSDPAPLSLTPLQLSPTIQLTLEDRCGSSLAGSSSGTVLLSVLVPGPGGAVPDATAQIFGSTGGLATSVFLSTGSPLSPSFSVQTSTVGPPQVLVRAFGGLSSALVAGTVVEAVRLVRLTTAALAFTDVAAGTSPLPSGTTSAALSASDPSGSVARVAFRLASAEAAWELVLSADGSGFSSPVLRAEGVGHPSARQVVAWDGVDRVSSPPRYAAPGRYKARLRSGGTAEDRTVEVVVSTGASFLGRLGARGAGAWVRAAGPGAAEGAFAVASSTGYFQLRGVREGAAYLLSASSVSEAGGRVVVLSTTVLTPAAAAPFVDLGTLSLPTTGLLRVAVVSPVPAPRELVGSFVARAADGSTGASGPLRFSSGSASSDDAGPLFGRSASTWSAAAAPVGAWTVEIDVPELRLSTAAAVVVGAGATVDLRLFPAKRAAITGYVVLPSTLPSGALVSVDARADGASAPAASAGAFVSSVPWAAGLSSAPYGLFGLDPGTYTVTASASGFAAVSSAVVVAGAGDVPLTLTLGSGAAIAAAVSLAGDSTALGTFDALIEARAAGRLEVARGRLRLGGSPALSSGTFALTGLSSGTWVVRVEVPGFAMTVSSGVSVVVPVSGSVPAALAMTALDARLRLEVRVPSLAGGACRSTQSYRSLGLVLEPEGGAPVRYLELPVLTPTFTAPRALVSAGTGAFALLHCASATVFTPALAPGTARVWAGFLDNGARAFGAASLTSGATATLALDLSAATTTVSGRVALSGELVLSTRMAGGTPFTVALSSAAGLNAWSPGPGPSILGALSPTGMPAFHVELLPVDPAGRASTEAVLASGVLTDGSFVFTGVSAGAWRLRVPGELDGDASNGAEAAAFETALTVATSPVTVSASLGRGAAVAGRVTAPGGTRLTRVLRVTLTAEDGSAPRTAEASFSDADSAPFVFTAVAAGRARLAVEDPGRPAVWVAAPRLVEVGAAGVSGLDLRLESAGSLLGRLAIARVRPDGTQEQVLLTRESEELLPAGFSIVARAAAPGSLTRAADAGLDADGRFLVAGLPPGTYDLELSAPRGLAPATVSGVTAAAGRATDLGTVVLRLAASASGRVSDAGTGLPVAGVAVSARPTSRASAAARTTTDAAGRYRFDGLDPAERYYDLTAAPRGVESAADAPAGYAAKRTLGVDVSTGAGVDFVVEPAASFLLGRVTTPDGGALRSSRGPGDASAPGAAVFLQRAAVTPEDDPLGDLAYRTGADGRFRIPSLSTGAYRLVVSAEGYGNLARAVALSTGSADLGDLLLPGGCVLSGALRRADGVPPSEDEAASVAAATPDLNEFVWGSIAREAGGAGVSYRLGGLKSGRTYRLLLFTGAGEPVVPAGGEALLFTSTGEARVLDLVARPPRPSVSARATRSAGRVTVDFVFSRALRLRTPADADPSLAATRTVGAGVLSGARLSADRRTLTVDYDPAVGETSFSLRARAAVAETDPDAVDPVFPELIADATAALRADVDAQRRATVSNALGGTLETGGDAGRVILPRGAFAVDAASTVALTFTRSTWNLAGAALPAGVSAASPFFDVALPAGVGSTLSRPAQLVLPYAAGLDPAALNLYWYNPGNGTYVLSPDALGRAPVVDAAARTYAVNVGHFSTFVLLPAGAGVIGGSPFAAGALEAYAFPNPFDLRAKTVTTIHGGGAPTIRGTMLRVSVPPGKSGRGRVRIFDVAGRLVRELDLGDLAGGSTYYRDWDGRTSSGADAASGLYLAQVEVGGTRKTFKLAVLK